MTDKNSVQEADKEYTVYEDEGGETYILMADGEVDENGEREQGNPPVVIDEALPDNAEDQDAVSEYGPEDEEGSRDPGAFDEQEYNRLNPMGLSASGSQVAEPVPVEPLTPPPRDPTPASPKEPTPPPTEPTPPPARAPTPPSPKESPRPRYQGSPQQQPQGDRNAPARKPAKGYIKGGMLIVDGGRWEPKAKVDHVNKHYHRSGGNVEIFNDKLKWNGHPKVVTKQRDYRPTGGDKVVFDEKLQWKASPRVDTDNRQHVPGGGDVIILHERLKWTKRPMVDAHNPDYSPAKGNFQMFEEKPHWEAPPRIDAKNKGYKPAVGNAAIIDDKLKWQKNAKVDHVKPFYKPGGGNIRVVSHRLNWEAGPKVDALNDGYAPPPEGGNVRIMDEKLDWNAEPKVEAVNPHYKKAGGKVKITNSKMNWRKNSVAKVETLDKFYEYEPSPDNVEFDPKTKRWVARGRIMRRPGTGKSLDTQLALADPAGGVDSRSEGKTTPINRAPAGTSYTAYAASRNARPGYGSRFQEKKMHGAPLHLPPIENLSPNGKNIVFKSKDLVSPRADEKVVVALHKPQPKGPQTKGKVSQKSTKEMGDGVRLVHRSVTPEYMHWQKANPREKQPTKSKPAERPAPPIAKKKRIEHLDMGALEAMNKEVHRLKPTHNPDMAYDEYRGSPVYTPTDSSFNDNSEPVSPKKGYNANRREREYNRLNNKFAATEGLYHVPTRKRAEKVYS